MFSAIKDSPIYKLINPDSIAFFGASNNFSSMGTSQLSSLLGLGFEGRVFPVHPKNTEVLGHKAYESVSDLPETPDLAILVLPTRIVLETVEQCGQKGIKNLIVVSGGFRESGGEGSDLEQALVETTGRYGIRFLGPNCLGVANPHHKFNSTFLPHQGVPGFVGMASQSGSFITQMFGYLSEHGLGFSTAVSVGNEADIDIVECLKYLGQCPHTKVICLYVEAIRNGKAFINTAREVSLSKPIVAYYVGGSDAGKQASLSHTGAMSGPDRLYDGIFHQCGVIRAESVLEMFDLCAVLGSAPMPRGNRIAIQTHSGGPGAVAADACERHGLRVPAMPDAVKNNLAAFVPHTGSVNNPVDITFSRDPLNYFSDIPDCLLADDHFDILLIYLLMPSSMLKRVLQGFGVPEDRMEEETAKVIDSLCDAMAQRVGKHGKPVIGFSFQSRQEDFIRRLMEKGIPVITGPHRAVRAMAALTQYAAWRNRH